MTVDWTKPIEAVHEDGRVVPVTGEVRGSAARISPELDNVWYAFEKDGSHRNVRAGWRIRNVQPAAAKTAEIDAALVERMVALMKRMAETGAGYNSFNGHGVTPQEAYSEARGIVAEMSEPVDPNIEAALDCLAHSFVSQTDESKGLALACILRGRQLEREAK